MLMFGMFTRYASFQIKSYNLSQCFTFLVIIVVFTWVYQKITNMYVVI